MCMFCYKREKRRRSFWYTFMYLHNMHYIVGTFVHTYTSIIVCSTSRKFIYQLRHFWCIAWSKVCPPNWIYLLCCAISSLPLSLCTASPFNRFWKKEMKNWLYIVSFCFVNMYFCSTNSFILKTKWYKLYNWNAYLHTC